MGAKWLVVWFIVSDSKVQCGFGWWPVITFYVQGWVMQVISVWSEWSMIHGGLPVVGCWTVAEGFCSMPDFSLPKIFMLEINIILVAP